MKTTLKFQKTLIPCTYKQVELMKSFDKFTTIHNNSQIMKRLSIIEASEIIDNLKQGEEVELN
jgi:hypothetical protein